VSLVEEVGVSHGGDEAVEGLVVVGDCGDVGFGFDFGGFSGVDLFVLVVGFSRGESVVLMSWQLLIAVMVGMFVVGA
jgi:hypothetical protein